MKISFRKFLLSASSGILIAILSAIGMLLLGLSYFLHDTFLYVVEQNKAASTLIWIALVLIVMLILSLILLFILLYKKKLKPAFTVLWDREFNAYCPICKTLLSHNFDFGKQESHFECKKCNKNFSATHSSGFVMSIKKVKETFENNWES